MNDDDIIQTHKVGTDEFKNYLYCGLILYVHWFCWTNTEIASFMVVFVVMDLESSGSFVNGLLNLPRRNHDTMADLS